MAEIIKFPGRDRLEKPKDQKENPTPAEDERIYDPRIDRKKSIVLMKGASQAFLSLSDISARTRARREMRDVVRGYSDEEIIEWINSSSAEASSTSKPGWMSKPAFYLALVDEAVFRKFMPGK